MEARLHPKIPWGSPGDHSKAGDPTLAGWTQHWGKGMLGMALSPRGALGSRWAPGREP